MFTMFKFNDLSFVPTEHDVKSVEELAKRLKGADDAETLVNVLEWLDRNLTYWTERAYLDLITKPLIIVGTVSLAVIMFPILFLMLVLSYILLFMFLGFPVCLPFIASLSFITSLIFLALLLTKISPSLNLLLIIFGSSAIYNLVVRGLKLGFIEGLVPFFLNLGVVYWMVAGGSTVIFIYLFVIYSSLTRHLKGMSKLRGILHLIDLTFTQELPVTYMLRIRRGICRDYAKLTASILINLFSNYKIYFICIPWHVATSIKIDDKMYVLDQKLPIMSLDTWLNRWGRDRPSKIFILLREDDKIFVKPVDNLMHKSVTMSFNLDRELAKLIEKIFNAIATGESMVSHTLAGYAKLFDINDKVVRFSLVRKVRIMLEKELASHVSLIKDIHLIKQDNDLVVNIALSRNSKLKHH